MKTKENSLFAKILLFAAGIAGSAIINEAFDWVVFPLVMSWFGAKNLWQSFLILYFSALILNYLLIRVYDLFKKDLFGFEDIKKLKTGEIDEHQQKKWKYRLMRKLIDHPRTLFIFISTWDPFLATLYKRETSNFQGFKKSDYWILVLSTFIGCLFWTILLSPSLLIDLQSIVNKFF